MKPGTLRELQRIVTDFAESLGKQSQKRNRKHSQESKCMLESGGSLFEFRLKKKRGIEPEV